MKYSALCLFAIVSILSCKSPIKTFPQYVHNKCNGKWAVKTGQIEVVSVFSIPESKTMKDLYFGKNESNFGYFSVISLGDKGNFIVVPSDTSLKNSLGNELQFDDSISAVNCYTHFSRKMFLADSLAKDAGRKLDSAFKCQHSYE